MTGGRGESVGQEKECPHAQGGEQVQRVPGEGLCQKQGQAMGLGRSLSSVLQIQTIGSCTLQGLRQASDHMVLPGT